MFKVKAKCNLYRNIGTKFEKTVIKKGSLYDYNVDLSGYNRNVIIGEDKTEVILNNGGYYNYFIINYGK